MVDAARKGLEWFAEGLAGDGLTGQTVREARDMVAGQVSEDKWVRIAAWISRHLVALIAWLPWNEYGHQIQFISRVRDGVATNDACG
jgi:hypothetical protein